MQKESAIGIFDSGVGGLSVWREIAKQLPSEDIIYFADSKNCPYGHKSQEEIIKLSEQIVDFLLSKNVKIIVVACNTATAAAINVLREKYKEINFVGLEPAIKPAAYLSKTKKIGVLATEGTFNGAHFKRSYELYGKTTDIHIQIGHGLVELVEKNEIHSQKAKILANAYLQPMIKKGVDQLVLGCTHYPFLCDVFKEVTDAHKINIINPAPAIAKRVYDLLNADNLLSDNKEPEYIFYTSGNTAKLKNIIKQIDFKDRTKYNIFKIDFV